MFRLFLAIVMYLLFLGMFILIKPSLMITDDNKLKQWGIGSDKVSPFSPMFIFPVVAMICYYIAAWIEIVVI